MIILSFLVAGIAALIHVLIFVLESWAWTGPHARSVFGTSEDEALATRELAFNQGFYNLFLAIIVGIGLAFALAGDLTIASTLVLAGAGSMAAAALVLAASSPDKRAAALKQGAAPLLAVTFLALGLVL